LDAASYIWYRSVSQPSSGTAPKNKGRRKLKQRAGFRSIRRDSPEVCHHESEWMDTNNGEEKEAEEEDDDDDGIIEK
jgi:hypothetical protein